MNMIVLLILTFDAVFSHLSLTNGCTVKVNEKSFADLTYLIRRKKMLFVSTNIAKKIRYGRSA